MTAVDGFQGSVHLAPRLSSKEGPPVDIRSQSSLFGGRKAPSDELLQMVSAPSSSEEVNFDPGLQRTVWSVSYNIPCLAETLESSTSAMMGQESVMGAGSTGMKLASVVSFFTNSLLIDQSSKAAESAKKLKDVTGEQLARISAMRAGMNISNTAVTTTIRGLTIASLSTTATVIQVAKQVLGFISSGLESIAYTLLMIPATLSATKQIDFHYEFNNYLDIGRDRYGRAEYGISFLFDEIRLDPVERAKALEIFEQEDFTAMLEEEVELSQKEYERLGDDELLFIDQHRDRLIQQIFLKESPRPNYKLIKEHVEVRLAKELSRIIELKEVKFARRVGPETLQILKKELQKPKEMQLLERLKAGEASATGLEDAEAIIDIALDENKKKMTLNILLIVGAIVGIGGLIVATIFTGGIPLYIGLSVLLVSELFMVGLDIYDFIQEIKEMKAAPGDRIALLTLSLVSILFVGIGVFIAPTALAKLIVILIGVIFASFQLGVLGWAWANHQNFQKV